MICHSLRRIIWILAIISGSLSLAHGQERLRVDEAASRIHFQPRGMEMILNLRVVNFTLPGIPAHVRVELLDMSGTVRSQGQMDAVLESPASTLKFTLPPVFIGQHLENQRDLVWYRLRYTITPESPNLNKPLQGLISVSEIAPQFFRLQVVGPGTVTGGSRATLRVRAIQRVTSRPMAGVTVQASLDTDDDSDKPLLTPKAVTDHAGFAILSFTLPQVLNVESDKIDVTVTGTLSDLIETADDLMQVGHPGSSSISTDKPLYQPGQTVHMRILAFGDDHKALANQTVNIEIEDPESHTEFATSVRTSKFGIAAADWQLPANLRLGTYYLKAEFDDDRYKDNTTVASVQISRYEIPTFSVAAKSDRSYYLPGQNAQVEVRADYLFGKPVRHGHVRVVREDRRNWNYREQKWDIEEGPSYEGDTDEQGHYVAHVDLTEDHEDLAENNYARFRDIHLAAYFTDASTRRTEQRRFDLRLSREPIHVYIIGGENMRAAGLPMDFFVSTHYADGSPAPCEIQIGWLAKPATKEGVPPPILSPAIPLRKVRTNRYGLAKVSGLKHPHADTADDNFLVLTATDRSGLIGHHGEGLNFDDRTQLRVATDKVIYRPGDPIEVSLVANRPDLMLFVQAMPDGEMVASQSLRMRGGHAEIEFPSNDKFQGEVSILVSTFEEESKENWYRHPPFNYRTVLFPKNRELEVALRPEQSTYRPGDDAIVNLLVSGPGGERVQSALGLVVVDKAVEERQRTDAEFGMARGFYSFPNYARDYETYGGVLRKDLDKLDPTRPLPDGMETVAEVLLQERQLPPNSFESYIDSSGVRQIDSAEIAPQIKRLETAFGQHHQQSHDYPETFAALKELLAGEGIRLNELRDPWGEPYRFELKPERESRVLTLRSAGPDKKFETADDLNETALSWRYFDPRKEMIQAAGAGFHARTGKFIRDTETLRSELARIGQNLNTWKDPWGQSYRYDFGIATTQYTTTVMSSGPDQRFSVPNTYPDDDFAVAVVGFDYAAEIQQKIGDAFTVVPYGEKRREFPTSLVQLQKTLALGGITLESFKDPWGHPFYVTFPEATTYTDAVKLKKSDTSVDAGQPRFETTPVTRKTQWIYIRSAGPDGVEGTPDDFTVASFSQARFDASGYSAIAVLPLEQSILIGSAGIISGTITDPSGAVIAGATATAKNLDNDQVYIAKSDSAGKYTLRNLTAGEYLVTVEQPGFKKFSLTHVPVRSSTITALDVTLRIGTVTMTVEVTGEAATLQSETAAIASAVSSREVQALPLISANSTPKLRDYFPETLLWQPEVITDTKGRAQIKFPLAGNITTWALKAVASTVDGETGVAQKEIRAFQPFFIDHDPPRSLTTGDEIDLPVILRNYLDHPIQANVEMAPQKWFSLATTAPVTANLAAGDSASSLFRFTAVSPVKQGKQRVTALSSAASDAIEKTVTVHPDGQEKILSLSQVFGEKADLKLEIPEHVVPGSLETSLKIYPNLNAHILEGIEAIMHRPYGCGEQTISSTYPSLLYLQAAGDSDKESPMRGKALHYLQLGYSRLISYQSESGGFTYWGRGEGDAALTAYAVRFLRDAAKYITVDKSVTGRAITWLLAQAQPDGRWIQSSWYSNEDAHRTAEWTAYIAHTLASAKDTVQNDFEDDKKVAIKVSEAVDCALKFVEPHAAALDEPYLIAAYALAALDAGQQARADEALKRLRQLEHREGNASYWALEMNTPFYGWGLTGRLETTALVVEALEKDDSIHQREPMADESVSRGLLFLLNNQDEYGVWYSSQATVNVLRAIANSIGQRNSPIAGGSKLSAEEKAEVVIDGKAVASLTLPVGNRISSPVTADLSQYLSAGTHYIELHRPSGASNASLQLLAEYYVPWTHTSVGSHLHHESQASEALRLGVHFDKVSAKPGDVVTCNVNAERVGFRGYGMMLAEIGLPPGAEVDRESLEKAMTASGWGISQYDIQPDRVVLYLWPQAGGVKFAFTFKFRYGVKALTPPSVLYDYYNPLARAEVEPTRFVVQP